MRVSAYKTTIVFVCLGLVVFLSNRQVQGQPEKPFNLNDIKAKLMSASGIDKPAKETNEQLVKEICNRLVNFTLTSDDEKSLKKAGASDLLIKTIRGNFPEEKRRMSIIYDIYVTSYESSNIEQTKIALGAAKVFTDNYKKNECVKEQIDYFQEAVPLLEEKLKWLENRARQSEKSIQLKRLDAAYKSQNYVEFFNVAAEILKVEPNFLDLILVLASIGFDQAKIQGNNSKFNDETIRYAELAVKLLKSGKESEYKDYGSYKYQYKTKTNALNKMNEIIEYMKNQKLN